MKIVNMLALVLVIVGAINWGLWGFFQFDLVAWIGGGNTTGFSRLIYSIVGLAGIWTLRKLTCCSCPCSGSSCNKDKGGSCCK